MRARQVALALILVPLTPGMAMGDGALDLPSTHVEWGIVPRGDGGPTVALPADVHLFGHRAGGASRTVALIDVSGHANAASLDVRVEYRDGSVESAQWPIGSDDIWLVRVTLYHAKQPARVVVGYQDAQRSASSGVLDVDGTPLASAGAVYDESAMYLRGERATFAFAYLIEAPAGTRVLTHWTFSSGVGGGASWWGASNANVTSSSWAFAPRAVSLTGVDIQYGWTTSAASSSEIVAKMQSGEMALPCTIHSGEYPPAKDCSVA